MHSVGAREEGIEEGGREGGRAYLRHASYIGRGGLGACEGGVRRRVFVR